MKKDMMKKLRSRAGETITETLVSVLIGALALVMLAGAVASGSGMITRSRNKLDEYYSATETMLNAISTSGGGTAAYITISFTKTGETTPEGTQTVSVRYAKPLDNTNTDVFSNTPIIVFKKSD